MWPAKSVGRAVGDTNPRGGLRITRNCSKLEDSWYTKVDLHVGGMGCETISLSYIPPQPAEATSSYLVCVQRNPYELNNP